MESVNIVLWVTYWTLQILGIGGGLLGAFAIIDALRHRADAYVAADKQTKIVWIGITALCALMLISAPLLGFPLPPNLLWLAAIIGAIVYVVDVRPRLKDAQRGTRW
ncbi:DUF2516 family protein [Nakamurella antarctica]|uniref:DUF2516 family protein n=1 Tax=Nakamurella antarctica TaxID=1902245 RepID=A0A3G8ZNU4_9ACTN|nr:DUF2516 family protein [Nakamurella antarctica]AZI58923.1 DUF2516 family protein [Nakamurella antarctica]